MSALAIAPHLVVRDAAAAAEWYTAVLGAQERGRLAVPGGKLMQVELRFGSSTVMLADEFPDMGVLSPLSIGGTATVLHLSTDDVDAVWKRAIDGGAEVRQPLAEVFWGRALRADHRPLRPSLGTRPARPRRPARAARACRGGAV